MAETVPDSATLLLLLRTLALGALLSTARAARTRHLLQAQCSGSTSSSQTVSGDSFSAQFGSGAINMVVDQSGQKASWSLNLCDMMGYVSCHLAQGGSVLVPLEPYTKPMSASDPNSWFQLCPAQDISGCSYSRQGSFTAGDLMSGSWDDFMSALWSGSIQVVVSTTSSPSGAQSATMGAAAAAPGPAPASAPGPAAPAAAPAAAAAAPAAPAVIAFRGTTIQFVQQPEQPEKPEQPETTGTPAGWRGPTTGTAAGWPGTTNTVTAPPTMGADVPATTPFDTATPTPMADMPAPTPDTTPAFAVGGNNDYAGVGGGGGGGFE